MKREVSGYGIILHVHPAQAETEAHVDRQQGEQETGEAKAQCRQYHHHEMQRYVSGPHKSSTATM